MLELRLNTGRDNGARCPVALLCCARLQDRSWCVLPDGHLGRCLGYASSEPPKPPSYGPKR